ncbi:MAG: tRNA-intron lyase [Candidatus Hadarchaeia archaeon]
MEEETPKALYFKERIIVPEESQANRIHQKGAIGKTLSGGKLQLAPVEALFLLDREKIEIADKESEDLLGFEELLSRLSAEDPEMMLKYRVYENLKSRGLVVKTGLKYGAHFRVYERGESPGSSHSPYLVHAISENTQLTPQDIARAVRLAHGVRKKMIFGVVDDEGDVTYYSMMREKL